MRPECSLGIGQAVARSKRSVRLLLGALQAPRPDTFHHLSEFDCGTSGRVQADLFVAEIDADVSARACTR
jgi:hypothetical protein